MVIVYAQICIAARSILLEQRRILTPWENTGMALIFGQRSPQQTALKSKSIPEGILAAK